MNGEWRVIDKLKTPFDKLMANGFMLAFSFKNNY